MIMPGRSSNFDSYRFGFNGMESDDEVSGEGNSYTTHFRQYDPRIMRWKSLDPAMAKYPGQSPYVAFNNNPIYFTDPFGDDPPEKLGKFKRFTNWLAGNSYKNKANDYAIENNIDVSEMTVNKNSIVFNETDYSQEYNMSMAELFDDPSYVDPNPTPQGFSLIEKTTLFSEESTSGKVTKHMRYYSDGEMVTDLLNTGYVPDPTLYMASGRAGSVDAFWTLPIGGGINMIRTGVTSVLFGAGLNFGSQMYAKKGDVSKVDWFGVAAGGGAGLFKNPYAGATVSGLVDAGFDYTTDAGLRTPLSKDIGHMANDWFWSSVGNYGSATFSKNPSVFKLAGSSMTTVPSTTINTISNDQLGY
ncbi:MAG: hypothetical protein COA32_17110 [Fluviicola sp.]|nr:MAG: hypothetical protein COA32_17110 [Fluviicola sp.]